MKISSCHIMPACAGQRCTPVDAVFVEKTYHTYYDPMRAVRTRKWKRIANFECASWQETPPDHKDNAKSCVEIANAQDVPLKLLYHTALELQDLEEDPYGEHHLANDADLLATRDTLIQTLYATMQDTCDPLLDDPLSQGA